MPRQANGISRINREWKGEFAQMSQTAVNLLRRKSLNHAALVGSDVERQPRMFAKCRSKSGSVIEFPVLDLSPIGCLVGCSAWSARADDRVLVQLEGLNYQPARVLWVEGDRAGIEFEQLLHEAVLERLKASMAKAA
jgi:hypothetical protein